MSIYAEPPQTTKSSFKEGDTHVGVASIQRTLIQIGATLVEDGTYGSDTKQAVLNYQRNRGLLADGIAGPATQHRMANGWITNALADWLLPERILDGQIEGESGWLIAAVGWATAGGVDCGFMQRRVLGPPWDEAQLTRAFDSKYQIRLSARTLRERYERFVTAPGVTAPKLLAYIPSKDERAWRLALLYHNYPAAADTFGSTPQPSTYWTTPQTWVTNHGYKFPDGAPVRTPFEWCAHYALSAPSHDDPGSVARYVTDWSV